MSMISTTVNVETFALYIFVCYSHLSHIRKNMYNGKISLTMPYRANNIKNADLYIHAKLPNLGKFIHAKICTFTVYVYEATSAYRPSYDIYRGRV